jgi:hypothetical protein
MKKQIKSKYEISVTTARDIIIAVSILVLVVLFIQEVFFKEPEITITKNICHNESIYEKNILDLGYKVGNYTINLYGDEIYIEDLEDPIIIESDYLLEDVEKIRILDVVNVTVFNYNTGKDEPYYYVTDRRGAPITKFDRMDWHNVNYIINMEHDNTNHSYPTITFSVEITYKIYETKMYNKEVCEDVEVNEIELQETLSCSLYLQGCIGEAQLKNVWNFLGIFGEDLEL